MKKELRIKKNSEFSQIIDQKKRYSSVAFVMYIDEKKYDFCRIGISVSKKLGNAVERNKIKRQVRMMLMSLIDFNKHPFDLIIIVRKEYLNNNYENNKNDLEKIIKKAII